MNRRADNQNADLTKAFEGYPDIATMAQNVLSSSSTPMVFGLLSKHSGRRMKTSITQEEWEKIIDGINQSLGKSSFLKKYNISQKDFDKLLGLLKQIQIEQIINRTTTNDDDDRYQIQDLVTRFQNAGKSLLTPGNIGTVAKLAIKNPGVAMEVAQDPFSIGIDLLNLVDLEQLFEPKGIEPKPTGNPCIDDYVANVDNNPLFQCIPDPDSKKYVIEKIKQRMACPNYDSVLNLIKDSAFDPEDADARRKYEQCLKEKSTSSTTEEPSESPPKQGPNQPDQQSPQHQPSSLGPVSTENANLPPAPSPVQDPDMSKATTLATTQAPPPEDPQQKSTENPGESATPPPQQQPATATENTGEPAKPPPPTENTASTANGNEPKTQTGGALTTADNKRRVLLLSRWRVIRKIGRYEYVTLKGLLVKLSQARQIEKQMRKKVQKAGKFV
jgi:hypothetical protein